MVKYVIEVFGVLYIEIGWLYVNDVLVVFDWLFDDGDCVEVLFECVGLVVYGVMGLLLVVWCFVVDVYFGGFV